MTAARLAEETVALRLPFDFDVQGLQTDLASLNEDEWIWHFNKSFYEGEWSGISLRSTSGDARQIYPDPVKTEYLDTPVLERTPYFKQVLGTFECKLLAARLLRLRAGSRILEHRDYNLSIEDGEMRIHIPVRTNPQLVFMLGGERLTLREGTCWYLNVNHPHSVDNAGSVDRIHLVFDCVVNDWVRELVARSERVTPRSAQKSAMDAFVERVLAEPMYQARLQACDTTDGLLREAAVIAGEAGMLIDARELENLIRERRREWATRLL